MAARLILAGAALLGLAGCNVDWCERWNLACAPPQSGGGEETYGEDADGDLWPADQDCDDDDPSVYPGAVEICDGIDNDCSGVADDGPRMMLVDWLPDLDGDGFGAGAPTPGCAPPSDSGAWTTQAGDCDDTNPAVHPGAEETCETPYDDDCDGETSDGGELMRDADGDGYVDPDRVMPGCEERPGWLFAEWSSARHDCDDTNPDIHPDAREVCDLDGVDEDCDGRVNGDDRFYDSDSMLLWYVDDDGDGYGRDDRKAWSCDQPHESYVPIGGDCGPDDPTIHPGAEEVCDGVDQDCDGDIDEGATGGWSHYADADGDGWGDTATSSDSCIIPSGRVMQGGDCDDTRDDVFPGAPETDCTDPTDFNCDGLTGDVDADADGTTACNDCDDSDPTRHPGATEVCDAADIDEDCDGLADDADPDVDPTTQTPWWTDADADGWGGGTATRTCEPPGAGWSSTDGDCDDTDSATSPDAPEVCGDGIDNNCDGGSSGCGLSGDVALWDAVSIVETTASRARLGTHVAWLGDQDGDGEAELAVAAPGVSLGTGLVAVVSSAQLDTATTTTLSTTNSVGLQGQAAGIGLGASLATGGDLDADGFDDLVVGAPTFHSGYNDNGAVWVVHGPMTGTGWTQVVSTSSTPVVVLGHEDELEVGGAVSVAGDVDGDGWLDLLIGSEYWSDTDHAAFLMSGPLTTAWMTTAATATVGATTGASGDVRLTGAGDVDGDGYADLLLADPTWNNTGGAALLLGPVTGELTFADADATVMGTHSGADAGDAVFALGDLDGDGVDDVGIGVPDSNAAATHGGLLTVFGGGTLLSATDVSDADVSVVGVLSSEHLGESAAVGDIDGDGVLDLMAGGAQSISNDRVVVWSFLGPLSGTIASDDSDLRVNATSTDRGAGASIAYDSGGDGRLAVGAPMSDVAVGRAFILENAGL